MIILAAGATRRVKSILGYEYDFVKDLSRFLRILLGFVLRFNTISIGLKVELHYDLVRILARILSRILVRI